MRLHGQANKIKKRILGDLEAWLGDDGQVFLVRARGLWLTRVPERALHTEMLPPKKSEMLPQKNPYLIVATVWNLCLLAVLAYAASVVLRQALPSWLGKVQEPLTCGLFGGAGGIAYCLRGVYVNACGKKAWDDAWFAWYIIRPFVSFIYGVVCYVFLAAGIFAFGSDAVQGSQPNIVFYYALAFFAGMHPDAFTKKIEKAMRSIFDGDKSGENTGEKTGAPSDAQPEPEKNPGGQVRETLGNEAKAD